MAPHNIQSNAAQEIDIGALKDLVARFKAHHALKLAATKQALTPRRRRALEVLPFLYHRNHPALPGYISPALPAGIANYRPSLQTRRELRLLAGGFRDRRERGASSPIGAVYLMGSSGSIAQTRSSDVDVWVCCPAHLHALLWPKVHVINQWANTEGLALQTFLVDPESFRTGRPIPGCAMPTLLLDEFYRSATFVAGRHPLWWLIPPGREAAHDEIGKRLRDGRYVDPEGVIDFGPVNAPTIIELAHGAAEELSRALSTPYKSLLKLKLVEAYAHQRHAPVVSHRYKREIYAGQQDPEQLDAYILVYQHLEEHLVATGQDEQLALVRRLLAQKILQTETSSDQRIGRLCQQWGIDTREILAKSTYSSLVRESSQVEAALQAGLRTATALDAQQRAHSPSHDSTGRMRLAMRVSQLQRMVRPTTSVSADTISRLNPAVAPSHYAAPIAVEQQEHGWIATERGETIYRCERLVELAVWAHTNNLSNLNLGADHALAKNLEQIRVALESNPLVQVFANAELDSQPRGRNTLLSRHDDPLDYSGLHHLHLKTLDTVTLTAKDRYQANAAVDRREVLLELTRLMCNAPQDLAWEAIGNQRRYRIQTRLKNLHTQLYSALRHEGDRFIFPFGGDLVCAEKRQETIATTLYASAEALQMALRGYAQHAVTFDNSAPRLTTLQ
jgi:adenylate cyclase class 1